jgi:protein-S-isoprenylcysteine O-methyltransferase Ste14
MVEIEGVRHEEDGMPTDEQPAGRIRMGDRERTPPRRFAWLASLASVLLLIASVFLERGGNAYLRVAGVVALGLAGVFIFAPFLLFREHGQGKGGGTYMQTEVVVDQGLYAITRHPQYLGYMLLACGFALLVQHWLVAILALAGIVSFYVQAVREERYCLAKFGVWYKQYQRRVPRFNAVVGIVRLVRRANS